VASPAIPLQIFDGNSSEGTSIALRYISGGTDVSSMIHALQEDGVLRVLAEPNVVAASGKEANFLSGGEIPIPIASSGGQGGSSITIEYKEYGVKVNFLPTIVDSGVISLQVAPEVSSLDYTNALSLSGFEIPALTVRRAETTVELEDGQVLVIGGLLIEEERKIDRKIPILGHIPLIGLLFSNSSTVRTQHELLLVVSPHIIRALPRGTEVALPGVKEEG
jgi:pilus assembly protein CpaC